MRETPEWFLSVSAFVCCEVFQTTMMMMMMRMMMRMMLFLDDDDVPD